MVNQDHILSSGLGIIHDPHLNKLLYQKSIFVLGPPDSFHYFSGLDCQIASHLSESDIIVFMSSGYPNFETNYQQVAQHLKSVSKPVICCNPDTFVNHLGTKKPVIGYYASELQSTVGCHVHWFGKPYPNYYDMVGLFLKKNKVHFDRCIFFDDRRENLVAMKQVLGVDTCLIRQTGVDCFTDQHNADDSIDFSISAFQLWPSKGYFF